VFIDEAQVENLEGACRSAGYLEGSRDGGKPSHAARERLWVWSFVVNNYLLGKDPFPFDLSTWNSHSTRMPAKMHSFYLP